MSRLVLSLTALITITIADAQTYYNMWRGYGESGKPEWLANTAMAYGFTGIQFTTADKFRGFVNGNGRWLFFDPLESVTSSQYVNSLNGHLNGLGNVAVGTQGSMAANRWVVTDIELSSNIDSYYGYGRNGDIVLSNQMSKWLRLNSYGGIAMWGAGGAGSNDLPQFEVLGEELNCYKKINLKDDYKSTRATFGLGRNYDVSLWVIPQKWLRVGSSAGIGLWMNGLMERNDTPQVFLSATYAEFKIPIVQRNGAITHTQNNITTSIGLNGPQTAAWIGTTTHHGLELGTNGTSALYIGENRNLFCGFEKRGADSIRAELQDKYNVFVRKGILAPDYAIAPVSAWADDVFDDDYPIRSLDELENFVTDNKHLPDVPSEEEVTEKGYSQHDLNCVLLRKIEELTLYIIQQKNEIETLKAEVGRKRER